MKVDSYLKMMEVLESPENNVLVNEMYDLGCNTKVIDRCFGKWFSSLQNILFRFGIDLSLSIVVARTAGRKIADSQMDVAVMFEAHTTNHENNCVYRSGSVDELKEELMTGQHTEEYGETPIIPCFSSLKELKMKLELLGKSGVK